MNAADEFGATRGLGGVLGAITISPKIDAISQALGLFNIDDRLSSILISGKGGIIGVIAGVALLAFLEKRIRKIVPYVLDVIITPFLSLILTALVTVFAIMPLAGVASDHIIKALEVLIMNSGPSAVIGGFILAALFLPLLMVGLHHGLIPFYLLQLENFGVITLFPILCMAGAGQIGAAIALYFKAKGRNEKLRDVIRGALPVGFLGIGEPLLYGVTLPMGLPFITASIAGGFAGAFAAATKVAAIAYGPAGLSALTIIRPDKMIFYFLSLCIAYVLGFIFTWLAPVPKAMDDY
jgi:PTS system sucrose-specific IIC component